MTRVSPAVADDATACCDRSPCPSPRPRAGVDFAEPAGLDVRSAGASVDAAAGGGAAAGRALAGGAPFADAMGWLISGREWVCTLPAANNASAVLKTKTAFITASETPDSGLQTKLYASG